VELTEISLLSPPDGVFYQMIAWHNHRVCSSHSIRTLGIAAAGECQPEMPAPVPVQIITGISTEKPRSDTAALHILCQFQEKSVVIHFLPGQQLLQILNQLTVCRYHSLYRSTFPSSSATALGFLPDVWQARPYHFFP
jgi:hypothetical protein